MVALATYLLLPTGSAWVSSGFAGWPGGFCSSLWDTQGQEERLRGPRAAGVSWWCWGRGHSWGALSLGCPACAGPAQHRSRGIAGSPVGAVCPAPPFISISQSLGCFLSFYMNFFAPLWDSRDGSRGLGSTAQVWEWEKPGPGVLN